MAEGTVLEDDASITQSTQPLSVSERLSAFVTLVEDKASQEDIDDSLRNSQGLLHEACRQGSVTAVKLLLERGVTTSEWDRSFLLPLHIVARKNLLQIAEALLKHNSEGVDRPSKFGETPLHFACMMGHKEMAELLIKYKANVERRDHCENTTLHYAVASDDPLLVEWLLRDKNMHESINAKNRFGDSPLNRAAVLQSVKVIPVLMKYRVKLSARDKFGFRASDIANILYSNVKVSELLDGEKKVEPIIPYMVNQLPPLDHDRYRSSSFSVPYTPTTHSQDGSTVSLPTSQLRKKPSATQAKRPVNLTFSNGYARQTSGISSTGSSSVEGSRNSLYLRDKEQANRLSEVLDRSVEDAHKVVRDQTAYDPPIDMYFIGECKVESLTNSSPRHELKNHDIRIKISEKYWIHNPAEAIECRLAAGLHWSHAYPPGHVFVSPICFISCRSKRSVEVTFTLPHALLIENDTQSKRVAIFTSPTLNGSGLRSSSPTPREFNRISPSDLTIDGSSVTFTTTIKEPILIAVGLAVAPLLSNGTISPNLFPIVPLRCCLYVACPSDQSQYLTSTDIWVYVGMSLKTVETAMKKHVVPHDFSLEEKRFMLVGPVVSVDGVLENSESDWESSKRGKGLFRYSQVALGHDNTQEIMSHHETYPCKEAFFVECHNPKRSLKFRVTVSCDKTEVVSMLATPYTPQKAMFGMSQIREMSSSPLESNSSSTDSIPLKTSSV